MPQGNRNGGCAATHGVSLLAASPGHESAAGADVAPRAWAAICDLVGGAQRVKQGADYSFGDSFIINFHHGADQPWEPPSPRVAGWHKDGDFFRHFLDSPEQGLLTIVLWSDIAPRSGGTFAATDSVRPIAQYLADHPEGPGRLRSG